MFITVYLLSSQMKLITVANPWHGHITDSDADRRLRNWSYITLQGKGKTKLTYLTVYWVNDQAAMKVDLNAISGGRGQQRANTQQLQILREENKNDTLPRHNCFVELRTLFKEKFAAEGNEVVMGADANESMTGNGPRSLRRLMSDLGLHDAIAFANPGQTRIKTMKAGGSETNDHILVTNGVLKFILGAGELHFDVLHSLLQQWGMQRPVQQQSSLPQICNHTRKTLQHECHLI
jgi:hypothetical protein